MNASLYGSWGLGETFPRPSLFGYVIRVSWHWLTISVLFFLKKEYTCKMITIHPRGDIGVTWCAAAISLAVVTATTLAGNSAVLFALRRVRRAPAHYPLASLATADLLVGAFVLPIAAARELFVFHLSQYHWLICSCWSTLDVLCCTASILSLCALGWERWCGITAPLSRARRARQARLYAVLVWPVSTVVAMPTAFIPSPKHFHPDSLCKCVVDVGWLLCTWLGYTNSALNPLVYAAASPTVRRALHSSLTTSSSTRHTDIQLSPCVRRPGFGELHRTRYL
ncbi:unnamed protein product [Diatraea saccharalis]|uniref:G-protein coupled receptors family 1 profile domain-containing protein n=1 Tax=Diatraea saccharalis TaxID=40085 RepID=A0A9N9QTZ4_9NEOP|nr:unnamed protein product [Diatraea saccharalis]